MLQPGTPIHLSADQRPTRRPLRPARPYPASLRSEGGPPDPCAEVVHELANALAGVTGALTLVDQRLASDEPLSRAELAEIVRSGRVSAELAASILRELREEGSRDPTGAVDVASAVDAAMAVVRGPASGRARLLPLVAGGGVVIGRRRDLVRVLVNLLKNAIEASDPERPNEIRVRTETRDGALAVVVEDSGRGMDAETLALVRSGRAAPRTERRGIGLVITRRLVEQMGGSLELDGVEGLGTRVRVVLPVPERAP